MDDPFSIESMIARARAGMKQPKSERRAARLSQRYVQAEAECRRKEAKMIRAFRAYDKAHGKLRRIESAMNKIDREGLAPSLDS